jgi:hypothetical protein
MIADRSRTLKTSVGAILCLVAVAMAIWFFQTQRKPIQTALPGVAVESRSSNADRQTQPPAAPGVEAAENARDAAEDQPATGQPWQVAAGSIRPTLAASGPPSTITDPSGLPPATVLQNMAHAVRLYGSMFGGNPVGSNAEITGALNGDNPKHARFLDAAQGLRMNDKGELIDSWGTPYFFHQLSGTLMEIHSAGPDKIMWTADDLVTR